MSNWKEKSGRNIQGAELLIKNSASFITPQK